MKKFVFLSIIIAFAFQLQQLISQDTSQVIASIKPSINITNPKGLEYWKIDSVVSVNWMIENFDLNKSKYIKLEFSSNGGATWVLIIDKVLSIAGDYNLRVPKNIFDEKTDKAKSNKKIRLRLTDAIDSNTYTISNEISVTKNKEKEKTIVHGLLFGSGDFESAFSPKKDTASMSKSTSIVNGSVGIILTDSSKFELSTSISIFSLSDTVVNNYGSSILIPKKGTISLGLNLSLTPFVFKIGTFPVPLGFYANISVSNGLWGYDTLGLEKSDPNIPQPVIYRSGNRFNVKSVNYALGAGLLLSYPGKYAEKGVTSLFRFELSIGFAMRQIVGDVISHDNGRLYTSLLRTDKVSFLGFQWGAKIVYNHLSVGVGVINLYTKNDRQNIPGLTTSQILLNVEFRSLFKVFDVPF